jgi:uncharacterized protein (TIGR02996 family)
VVKTEVRFEKHGPGASFVELTREDPRFFSLRWGGLTQTSTQGRDVAHAEEAQSTRAFERQVMQLERKRFIPGHHEPHLIAALQANPNDVTPYAVYADWLLEKNDARGALINAMCHGNSDEVRHLFENHSFQLRPTWWAHQNIEALWQFGFVKELHISNAAVDGAQPLIPRTCDTGLLGKLLRHPSCAVVQKLKIVTPTTRPEGWAHVMANRPVTLSKVTLAPGRESRQLARENPDFEIE